MLEGIPSEGFMIFSEKDFDKGIQKVVEAKDLEDMKVGEEKKIRSIQ